MGKTKTKLIDDSTPVISKKEYNISLPSIGEKVKTKKLIKKKAIKKQQEEARKQRSQKYLKALENIDKSKLYSIDEAVETVKKASYSKFTGSLEIHINTRQGGIRGLVNLPYTAGKKLVILAFGKGAEKSGADQVGSDAKIDDINKGKIDFDIIISDAEWMPKLAKVARVLGPKELMPNPKNGTITSDLKYAVESFQTGKTEYKNEPKAQVIHLSVGKLDQPTSELSENVKVLLSTIGKSRIKNVTLAPTMGPSVRMDHLI